ncbi:sulfotransferase domain-containing protein [Pseudodesulfovibrio alkaliphilus]|nr:sulfotransferase domain-containing protein [Pseudodesulfovibrio alkaliphilus]
MLCKDACTVVSYPKSGRTWLEQLFIGLACSRSGRTAHAGDTYQHLASKCGMPMIRFTHAGSSWESGSRDAREILRTIHRSYAKKEFVLLVRDPRDVLVSSYYHMVHRTGIPTLEVNDMIDSPLVGLPKLVAFMNHWWDYTLEHGGPDQVVRYEELRANTIATFERICGCVGISAAKTELADAVENANFEKLKARERRSDGSNPWLTALDVKNEASYKMRKGRVGEYREFFSEEQQERIDSYIKATLRDGLGYK